MKLFKKVRVSAVGLVAAVAPKIRNLAEQVTLAASLAAFVFLVLASGLASAADPTYTSQIGPMLSGVNMTALNEDLAAWGAVAIAIFLTLAGIALVRKLLHKVMGS